MADQALLSGTGFLVAGALVATSSKQEFATYSLYWASIQLTTSVQNAAILTPLTANFRKLHGIEQQFMVRDLCRLGQLGSIAAACIAFIVCGLITAAQGRPDWLLASAVGIAIVGTWARELRRTVEFSEIRAVRVLQGDLLYAALLAAAIFVGWTIWPPLGASGALIAWGIAGLGTGGHWGLWPAPGGAGSAVGSGVGQLLREQTRWTLPSVAISWLQANAFNFVAAGTSGMHSVSDLNSARLLAAPVSMAHAGWNRIFLPITALALSLGDRTKAVRLGIVGVGLLSAGCLAYGASVFIMAPLMQRLAIAIQVEHLGVLVGLWLAYMLVVGTRGIGTSILVAEGSFASLFVYGATAAATTIAAMVLCGRSWGSPGIMVAMIAGEATLSILVWRRIAYGVNHRRAESC